MTSQRQCRRVTAKLEGSPLDCGKQSYSAPIYVEPPDLFSISNFRSYNHKDFSEKYGLHFGGINPKYMKTLDLSKYLRPVLNKNGHMYMFL